MVEGAREISGVSFIRSLPPFRRAPPSLPYHPPPNAITLGVMIKHMNWEGAHTLGRKVMTNLDSILKSRDITLSTKVRLVKAMVFPVVMYGSENWTIKKAEC